MTNKDTIEKTDNEIHFVTYYSDTGHEFDDEYPNLKEAIKGLVKHQSTFEAENGYSFNSLRSEPILRHPSDDDREWSLNEDKWV